MLYQTTDLLFIDKRVFFQPVVTRLFTLGFVEYNYRPKQQQQNKIKTTMVRFAQGLEKYVCQLVKYNSKYYFSANQILKENLCCFSLVTGYVILYFGTKGNTDLYL